MRHHVLGVLTLLSTLFITFSSVAGQTVEQAAARAVLSLKASGTIDPNTAVISIEVVNLVSKQKDETANIFEEVLYFAMKRQNFHTKRLSNESPGSSSNTIFIKGTHQSLGNKTLVRLKAIKDLKTGEVLDQFAVFFKTTSLSKMALVAEKDPDSDHGKKRFRVVQTGEIENKGVHWLWHFSAITLGVAGAYQAFDIVEKYEALAKINSDLNTEHQSPSISQERRDAIPVEFEANKKTLTQYKSDLLVYQGVITLAVLWEGYLLFFADDERDPFSSSFNPQLRFSPPISYHQPAKISLRWDW